MVAEGKRASLPLAVCSERELGYIVGTVFERLLTASELLFLAYAGALSLASQNQSFEKISSYEISRVEADSDREDVILQGEFESTIENEDARICLIGKAAQVAECKDDAESDDDDEDDDDDDDDAEEGDDDDDDAEEGEDDDDDDDVPVNNPADDEDDEDENGNEEDDDDDDDDDDDEEDEDDDEDDEEDDDEDEEPPAKKKK